MVEAFQEGPKTVAAVEGKRLFISEAAMRLGKHRGRLCPGLPWHNIRGIGNWLRHRYDRVDALLRAAQCLLNIACTSLRNAAWLLERL